MNMKVSKFVEIFQDMPDQRQEGKIRHKLVDILFICVVATIADCDDWEEIEWFATEKEKWFRQYIELPSGIPSHDTLERVFAWLEPAIFLEKFMEWTRSMASNKDKSMNAKGVIAIDGKTMRRSKDVAGNKKALHVVNAWFSETGMILGQVDTEEKSNEVTAIPELLDVLDVAGHIVTIDAMGTQKKIAEKIIERKGDYVLALKGNQGNLHEDVKLFFETQLTEDGIKEYEIEYESKREKGHGRIEYRQYYMTDKIGWLSEKSQWEGLRSIGMVRCQTENISTGAKSDETRYFISSLTSEVHRFAYAVRQHWGVESMHWSLDMTFNEDGRRSRKDNSAKNLSRLLRFAYNVLKSAKPPRKGSLKKQRKMAGWNEEYLEDLITGAFCN